MLTRRFVVTCNDCRHLVMMPEEIGPKQVERLRLHTLHHLRERAPGTAERLAARLLTEPQDILRRFHVALRQTKAKGAPRRESRARLPP